MAINYNEKEEGKKKGILEIDNGDLEAFRSVMNQYGFVNEEALLRYALVALLQSSDNKLYIRQDGNVVAMKISEQLIKKSEPEKPNEVPN